MIDNTCFLFDFLFWSCASFFLRDILYIKEVVHDLAIDQDKPLITKNDLQRIRIKLAFVTKYPHNWMPTDL